MRYKRQIVIFSIEILLIGFLGCKNGSAQKGPDEEERIKKTLITFYTHYIKMKLGTEFNNIDSLLGVYCTDKMKDYMNKLYSTEPTKYDYDLLLKAQMFDDQMLERLNVQKDDKKADLYYVSYGGGKGAAIQILVVKEKDAYKIDHVFIEGVDEKRE